MSMHCLEALAAKYGREIAVKSIVFPEKATKFGVVSEDTILVDAGREQLFEKLERLELQICLDSPVKNSKSLSR